MFWLYFNEEYSPRYTFNSMVELIKFVKHYDMGIVQHYNMTVSVMNAPICKLSVWNNVHTRNDVSLFFLDENWHMGNFMFKY